MTKKTETKELNIHQRLHAVMKDIDYVQKGDLKVNKQYKFVSHDAVTAKCRKAFVEHGVLTIPSVLEILQNGNKTTLKIEVKFTNIDDPEDFIPTISYGDGIDSQDKGIGKAYSYAVKYAYLKVLGLETGDDPERDSIDHIPTSNDEIAAKALGGSIASSLAPEERIKMYNQGITMLGACANLDKLQETFKKYWKPKVFTEAEQADIKVKYDECKAEIEAESKQEDNQGFDKSGLGGSMLKDYTPKGNE